MIRQLKVPPGTAVKARATTMVTLKAMLVHAPESLRDEMARKTQIMLARRCAALTIERLDRPGDSIRITLASLARRWLTLDHEAAELHEHIGALVKTTAPQLVQSYGIGADTAAEILIVSVTTRSASSPKQRWPGWPGSARSLRPQGRQLGNTGSTTAATDNSTPQSTEQSSYACAFTNPPKSTSHAAPPKERPKETSSAA